MDVDDTLQSIGLSLERRWSLDPTLSKRPLSKWFYDTWTNTATRVARCGSFVGEGLGVSDVLSYGRSWWRQGFTWFGPPEHNTLCLRENRCVVVLLCVELAFSPLILTSVVAFYSTRLLRLHCGHRPVGPLYHRGSLPCSSWWCCYWRDECHVISLCHVTPMCSMASGWWVTRHCSGFATQRKRVTLHCCRLLCVTSRLAPYLTLWCVNVLYAFNATHMSCMAILYAFNALPTPRAWRGHDEPDVRHLGNARARLRRRWAQLSK
jgi:hypothetical protein